MSRVGGIFYSETAVLWGSLQWEQGVAPGEEKKRSWIPVSKKKKKKSIPFLFLQSNPEGRLSHDNKQQHFA